MSYTDKCCGVCAEYQDLYEIGKLGYYKYIKEVYNIERRFYNDKTNVCRNCIASKTLEGVSVNSLTLHKRIEESKNITKGWEMCVDPKTRKLWRCPYNRLEQFETNKTLKFSKPSPEYYEVTGLDIKHEGLFSQGGIFCYDKRNLRKTLRKLGVKGNIKKLIK